MHAGLATPRPASQDMPVHVHVQPALCASAQDNLTSASSSGGAWATAARGRWSLLGGGKPKSATFAMKPRGVSACTSHTLQKYQRHQRHQLTQVQSDCHERAGNKSSQLMPRWHCQVAAALPRASTACVCVKCRNASRVI